MEMMSAAERCRCCGEAVVLMSSKCWRRFSVMKAKGNGKGERAQHMPYTSIWDKAVIALSVSLHVEWSEWYCPAECSMMLSLCLAPSLCMG